MVFITHNMNQSPTLNMNQLQEEQISLLVEQYLQEMGPLEKQAYEIAKSHLGTSFNIIKSNGFIQWKKNR